MFNRPQQCFLILSIFAFKTIKCDTKDDVRSRVKEMEERSRRLYGDTQGIPIKLCQLDVEDSSLYPNGDERKLGDISRRWLDHYRCTSRLVDSVTSAGRLPSVSVTAYEGAAAALPCSLCVAPGESGLVRWMYARFTHNSTFKPLEDSNRVICNVNLTIYNVQQSDAGLYRCQLGASQGGLVHLEVIDDERYDVVTVQPNHQSDAAVQTIPNSNLVTFTSWSDWSECSRCDQVGKRRRYGICYVRLNNAKVASSESIDDSLFRDFPAGVGCTSRLLPPAYRNNSNITARNNVIMTAPCETPCTQIFAVRSGSGAAVERADNSAGLYSLEQSPPPQPPPPERDVVFVASGDDFTIKCPGTTLRDVPITWRRGSKYLDAATIGTETGGRVRLDARDRLVFAAVQYEDANTYSCWQWATLAGAVELQVRRATGRALTLAWLTVTGVALHYAVRLLRSKQRRAQ